MFNYFLTYKSHLKQDLNLGPFGACQLELAHSATTAGSASLSMQLKIYIVFILFQMDLEGP